MNFFASVACLALTFGASIRFGDKQSRGVPRQGQGCGPHVGLIECDEWFWRVTLTNEGPCLTLPLPPAAGANLYHKSFKIIVRTTVCIDM